MYVDCREDDKVADNSGQFMRALTAHEGLELSLHGSGLEGNPVLKYFLSAIFKKKKRLRFKLSYPSRYGLGRVGVMVKG